MPDENQDEQRLRELLCDPRWSIAPRPGIEVRIRGAARRQRLRTARTATAVIAVLTAAIVVPLTLLPGGGASSSAGTGPAAAGHPARAGSATGHATITINPQAGETFAPAPVSARPELTAQQAWARYMNHLAISRAGIPSGTHAQLGLFTLPVGPANLPVPNNLPKANGKAYSSLNELAYGYSAPSACVTINPRLVAPPNARCLSWTFLNADTGQQIVSTYQQIGHWHWLIDPKAP
jgi:hypothetical protein